MFATSYKTEKKTKGEEERESIRGKMRVTGQSQ